jgi:DNA-binding FrmR family transcriptional regulator
MLKIVQNILITNIPIWVYNELIINKPKGDGNMDYNAPIKNRVKRIEGQLRGILRMMQEQKECTEVITQLSAARTAIDRTIGVVVSTNLVECVQKENEQGEINVEQLVKNAVNLLVKSR